ncbi:MULTISPECIES: endonuclease/exonuclease/phosphatase family protein [Alphaproteobacteria]|uniref:Endonuclease n=2 Tax=Alphaproteobacteria TaxID=28211 RepID=A0A512HCB5_9HYPH|nr:MULTISPECIES: endonuclease/exonuclease/phosphatase family protein [Alphaproteobacteria]GEO83089.1 endonuclease [Ciceribacter naphthalenivorans]GLR20516.1 endonuclease [Ciceribacter naphthalenivorans]GLT03372.1 endonuclease [Sphingomonas psychrolutea]
MTRLLRATIFSTVLAATPALAADAPSELTVMSFNIWGGGANEDKDISETAAVIRASGADIIGIQETKPEPDVCDADDCVPTGESVASDLAKALGFHYYEQTKTNPALWANAILSRYPIGKPTANDLGAEIDVGGRKIYAFNIQLTDYPYQPYQLLGIDYGSAPFLKTADEAIKAAAAARGPALDLLMKELKGTEAADAVFLFGDLREPSYRDWTEAAVKAGHQPMVVKYPSALRIEQQGGFTDLLRAAYPDEVAKPAFTWTPTTEPNDPQDHHDRIDYIFARGKKLETLSVSVVGEKSPDADIVVTPWPSNHRAVVAKVHF